MFLIVVAVVVGFFHQDFIVPSGKLGLPYPGEAQQSQEQRNPFVSVSVVFSCVQTIEYGCQFGGFLTCD